MSELTRSQECCSTGSRVGFEPDAILSLISEKYPRPLLALLEAIQNAVDSKAKQVEVTVNLKDRSYIISDNGCGMSVDQFRLQVEKIGRSNKAADQAENYGKFGYGLVSFFGKFEDYTLTSTNKQMKSKPGWEGYHTHDIAAMVHEGESLIIPITVRGDLAKSIPWWNTQVVAKGTKMKQARLIFNLSDLADEVAKRYGEGIARNGGVLVLTLIGSNGRLKESRRVDGAPVYRGKALKVISENYKACGNIGGQLHFRQDKAGTIYCRIGTGLNRLPLHPHIGAQLVDLGVKKDVVADLASGWFDGEISCQYIEMNVDRLHLVESDALLDFGAWLQDYHASVLDTYTRELQEDAEQRLDRALLTQVAEALRGINLNYFTNLIGAITGGAAITKRNFQDNPEATQIDPGTSRTTQQPTSKPVNEPKDRESKPPGDDDPPCPKGLYIDVVDDAGHARKFSPNQLGIRLCLDDLRGSSAHFQWEPEFSLLVINRRHPDYAACKGDTNRKRLYLETIIKVALPLQLVSEEIEGFMLMREALVRLLVHDIVNPEKADRPGRKR